MNYLKKAWILPFLVFVMTGIVSAQDSSYSISFTTDKVTIERKTKGDTVIQFPVKINIGAALRSSTAHKIVVRQNPAQQNTTAFFRFDDTGFASLASGNVTEKMLSLVFPRDTAAGGSSITLVIQVFHNSVQESDANNKGQFKSIQVTMKNAVTPVEAGNRNYALGFANLVPVQRQKSDVTYPVYINADSLGSFKDSVGYDVSVFVNTDSTDIPPASYSLLFPKRSFKDLDTKNQMKNIGFLTIYKDSLEDRQRRIFLELKVQKGNIQDSGNTAKNRIISIPVKGIAPANDTLKAYNYLAYIGTNFDLVDGPKAKNLFFATNILLPPTRGKGLGMYLSLYGNRTMTSVDTVGNIERTTKVLKLTDTTYMKYNDRFNMSRSQVSDNLGAYISPLIRLGGASSLGNKIQLYYTPSLEFVWRRTNISSVYSSANTIDSILEKGKFQGAVAVVSNSNVNFNEFVFNVGALGFMLIHESNEISVRVHCSTGYASIYRPSTSGITRGSLTQPLTNNYSTKGDMFFCGRAWITEATTGITLQAEITNTLVNPRPFYGVTLSKAINFKNIGKIFQPIVAR